MLQLLFAQVVHGQERITIDPSRTSSGRLAMSDLIESIDYIPLETDGRCYIGDIRLERHVLVSPNYILICYETPSSGLRSFYLFNRKGKFIAQIGSFGRGPEEYFHNAMPYAIDESSNQIVISNSMGGKLMYYDMAGKFVKAEEVDRNVLGWIFRAKVGNQFFHANSSVPTQSQVTQGRTATFSFRVISNDNKLIRERTDELVTVWSQDMHSFYVYNGQLHYKQSHLNDTLYRINQNLLYQPKYIINAGRYSVYGGLSAREFFQEKAAFTSVFETDSYLLISYRYKEKSHFQYYDKKSRRSFMFDSNDGIPNDYDGGLDFWPRQQNGNEFVAWYNAYLFEENQNATRPKGSRQAIGNFTQTVREIEDFTRINLTEANPVIVIVKLKQ